MDELISRADKEVLVELVKFIQKQGRRGVKGGWKEFLGSYDKQFGAGVADPAKRSAETLTAFVRTFNREEDVKAIAKMLTCLKDRKELRRRIICLSSSESPEQNLVRMTLEHPQYMQNYYFPSHEEGWVIIPLCKTLKVVSMVAIDCEMVLCEDGSEAVVKVCLINHNLEVVLDRFVKPEKVVVDYRENITGVRSCDLEGETCSLVDIQRSLKKILRRGTILVGHSLHNDLRALKIDYPRVIDTTYIFRYENLPPSSSPSLISLCKFVLNLELRKEGEPHNCLDDARAAMKLAIAKLEHGFLDPITIEAKSVLSEDDLAKLLIHQVPVDVPCMELRQLFHVNYDINIQEDTRIKGKSYSTFVVFKDSKQANEAFEGVHGTRFKDSFGRPQKRAMLKTSTGKSTILLVRKMVADVLSNKSGPMEISTDHEKNVLESYPKHLGPLGTEANEQPETNGSHDCLNVHREQPAADDRAKLLLRSVPVDVPSMELLQLFHGSSDVHILNDLRIKGDQYSTFAVFKDSDQAGQAFERIQGLSSHKGSSRRPQKLVVLKTSTGRSVDLCIRKMACDTPANTTTATANGSAGDQTYEPGSVSDRNEASERNPLASRRERSADDEMLLDAKRQRACLRKCSHATEVERLRDELRQREDEIFHLQKALSAVSG